MDVTYLDFNASSPLPREITGELGPLLERSLGNPSSLHRLGRSSRHLISEATDNIAHYLDCDPQSIYWTSGASEANSWALSCAVASARAKSRIPRLIISSIEHESTLLAAEFFAKQGASVEFIRVLPSGEIDLNHLNALLADPLKPSDLVSVMHSNNETGVIQPISQASALCKANGIPLHVDCVQSFGRVPLRLRALDCSFASFSGHKLGSLKGTGFLVANQNPKTITPLIHGKQQRSLRGGTENSLGVAMLGHVVRGLDEGSTKLPAELESWHRKFEALLKENIPGVVVHGESANRLPNTSFIGFKGLDTDSILMSLDLEGVCASAGSACSSGSLEPSFVLLAMGCDRGLARSSVRFSSGHSTTWTDFEKVLQILPKIVNRVKSI